MSGDRRVLTVEEGGVRLYPAMSSGYETNDASYPVHGFHQFALV